MSISDLHVCFAVRSVSSSSEALVSEDGIFSRTRLHLIIAAERGTPIQLSTGQWLEEMEIHITASDEAPKDSASIGFLCLVPAGPETRDPLIHGHVYIKETLALHTLLTPSSSRKLLISLDGASWSASRTSPHVFKPHREGSLLISSYTLSSKHFEVEQGRRAGEADVSRIPPPRTQT